MAEHPRYVGTDRPILIGDIAHDGSSAAPRTGTVVTVGRNKVGLEYSPTTVRHALIEWLCIGPASEPIELTIRPTRDELRRWVAAHDREGSGPGRAAVIAAIPADLLAELRAEIEAERQS